MVQLIDCLIDLFIYIGKLQISILIHSRNYFRKRDCQDGLLDLYRQTAKIFLQLDGARDRDSLFADVQAALQPEMQRRYEDLIQEPTMNILKGLHQSQQDSPYEPAAILGQKLMSTPSPSGPFGPSAAAGFSPAKTTPPHQTICQFSKDELLTVELIKFELAKEVCDGEVKRLVQERRGRIEMANEKPDRLDVTSQVLLQPVGLLKVKK